MYCYFGHSVTDKCDKVAKAAYMSAWYGYPLRQQKYFILILARAQQPLFFTALDIADCSLDTFKQVNIWTWLNVCLFTTTVLNLRFFFR